MEEVGVRGKEDRGKRRSGRGGRKGIGRLGCAIGVLHLLVRLSLSKNWESEVVGRLGAKTRAHRSNGGKGKRSSSPSRKYYEARENASVLMPRESAEIETVLVHGVDIFE